jgi:L-lactate dehydrogenase (cytochrome)
MSVNSEPIHPPGTLEQYLPKEKHLGPVDLSGLKIVAKEETSEEKARKQRVQDKPPLDECLSLYDFEVRLEPCPGETAAYCAMTDHDAHTGRCQIRASDGRLGIL